MAHSPLLCTTLATSKHSPLLSMSFHFFFKNQAATKLVFSHFYSKCCGLLLNIAYIYRKHHNQRSTVDKNLSTQQLLCLSIDMYVFSWQWSSQGSSSCLTPRSVWLCLRLGVTNECYNIIIISQYMPDGVISALICIWSCRSSTNKCVQTELKAIFFTLSV